MLLINVFFKGKYGNTPRELQHIRFKISHVRKSIRNRNLRPVAMTFKVDFEIYRPNLSITVLKWYFIQVCQLIG